MRIEELTETEVAYIAGLIDGEGSINMTKTVHLAGDRKTRFRVRLTVVATTSLELLGWISSKLGACVYRVGTPQKPQHRQGWCAKLAEGNAEKLIRRTLPYLVIKKRHAELFLRYREVQKYATAFKHGPKKDILALRTVRDWFFEEFRRINAKGPESVEANTPDVISEPEVMKIESDLHSNMQRVSGDAAPPTVIQ